MALVSTLLEKHYRARRATRAAWRRRRTTRSGSGPTPSSYLVKVSPPDEPAAVVAMQTAAMRFLERAAPRAAGPTGEADPRRRRQPADHDERRPASSPAGVRLRRRCGPGADEPGCGAAGQGGRDAGASRRGARGVRDTLPTVVRLVWDIRHFHQLTELVEHTPRPRAPSAGRRGLPTLRRHDRPEAERSRNSGDPRRLQPAQRRRGSAERRLRHRRHRLRRHRCAAP